MGEKRLFYEKITACTIDHLPPNHPSRRGSLRVFAEDGLWRARICPHLE